MSPAFGRMCASLVLSEGGESPARDAGSTAQPGDDPLCWKKADLSPEVRVAEEPGKHEAQGRIQNWQEGRGRAGQPRIPVLDPGRGRGAGCPQLQWPQDSPGGGCCRRREDAQEERNPCYGLACRGGVLVMWSPVEAGSLSHVPPSSRSPSGATSLSELLPATAGGCQEGLGEDTEVLFTQVPTKGPEVGWEGAVVILGSVLSILTRVFAHKNGISY